MAKNNSKSNTNSAEDTEMANDNETVQVVDADRARSASIDVGPDRGNNVLAAWRGIEHLLGGTATFEVVPGEGVLVKDFSTYAEYDPETVVTDVSGRDRRVDLFDALPIINGGHTPAFTEPLDMTKWMQQYFRKPGEDGKSPQYIKDAIAAYKSANGFPGRRGRPKKIIRIENLGSIDPATLAQLNGGELEALAAAIEKARSQVSSGNSEAASTEAVEVTA